MVATGLALVTLSLLPVSVASRSAAAKDIAPTSARCDALAKGSAEWTACAGVVAASDSERFYAGYWLAKSGAYRAALDQFETIGRPDARVLTYIGFAHRKLGAVDVALGHYGNALAADPNFTVARAYLGEAYLTLGRRADAGRELDEIALRCGRMCAEYAELEAQLVAFDAGKSATGASANGSAPVGRL
jgi:tetratricopeptide (TPR) repeat protein